MSANCGILKTPCCHSVVTMGIWRKCKTPANCWSNAPATHFVENAGNTRNTAKCRQHSRERPENRYAVRPSAVVTSSGTAGFASTQTEVRKRRQRTPPPQRSPLPVQQTAQRGYLNASAWDGALLWPAAQNLALPRAEKGKHQRYQQCVCTFSWGCHTESPANSLAGLVSALFGVPCPEVPMSRRLSGFEMSRGSTAEGEFIVDIRPSIHQRSRTRGSQAQRPKGDVEVDRAKEHHSG